MVPDDDYSETTTYEVDNAQATARFEIQGSAYHMVELR